MTKLKRSGRARRKLEIAKVYLKLKIGIVAIRRRSKAPDPRFCPSGSHDATNDLARVEAWLAKDDRINLAGVVLGTDYLILDTDGPAGEAALKEFGKLPKTLEVRTPNGSHRYYRHGGQITGSMIGFRKQLDIIASGYALAPESIHPDGGRYEAVDLTVPVADLPPRAIKLLKAGRGEQAQTATAKTDAIKKGQRDITLTRLAGSFRRQSFDEPVIAAALTAVNDAFCQPPLDQSAVDKIARSVARYDPADDELFDSMANVTPREVDFLWEPYLVRGAVNLLEGDPNVGKTYLLCCLAAAVSSGSPLPGQAKMRRGRVLFMSAEDDPETTLVRRLKRMGASLKRITYTTKFFRLEEEALGWIERHIIEKGVDLVILDPLLAYMQGGIDMNKANETRPFMARLADLAKSTNATIVALRHLNKSDKEKAIFRGLGSIDITAAARSAILIGEHPEDPAVRALVHIKHNLSEQGQTQLYELTGGDKAKGKVPTLKWLGASDLTAADLAHKAGKPGRPDTASSDAKDYLRRMLSEEPTPIQSVISAGEKRAFSDRTLRRAARELGVLKEGKNWKLAKTDL